MLLELVGVGLIGVGLLVGLRFFYGKQGQLWYPNEDQFVDPNLSDTRVKFGSLSAPPTVQLSIIIPAYNEKERLPVMLDETLTFLKQREAKDPSFSYELIIVDDGSKDNTSQIALKYSKKETTNKVRVLTLMKNRGKGGAVKRGMLVARGKVLLMADADAATKIEDLLKLEKQLDSIEKNQLGIALGSRRHLQKLAEKKRKWYRNILMWGFHILVDILCVKGIADTQCGFKLFTRKTAQILFPNQNVERWAFDVELLYLAQRLNVPLVEVDVNWTEVPGSTLTPFAASVQMGKDLVRIRSAYLFGIWRIDHTL